MLKETLVNKYFKNAWKSQICVERSGENYWVTNNDVILKLPINATLFNDRAMFPELPGDGKCFTYSKTSSITKDGFKITECIRLLISYKLDSVNVTPWAILDTKINCRLLLLKSEKILIDQRFFDWFDMTPNAFTAPKSMKPVILSETATFPSVAFDEVTAAVARLIPSTGAEALKLINAESEAEK